MSGLPAQADSTGLDLTANFKYGRRVKRDQAFLPLCVPFVEFKQAGSRAGSNPRVPRGSKRTAAGFIFNRGKAAALR